MVRSATKICRMVTLALSLMAAMGSLSFAAPFQVTKVSLTAIPATYDGVCPAKIKFSGNITASGPGDVKYIFTRSDGAVDKVVKTVTPSGLTGFKGVADGTWTLGDPIKLSNYSGWMSIKIISPNPMESNKAKFTMVCSKKQADLVVKEVTSTTWQPVPGTSVQAFDFVIANQGNAYAWPNHICISNPEASGKSYLGPVPSLAAGTQWGQGVLGGNLKAAGVDPGKGLLFTVDCKNEVVESNENNNTYLSAKP